MSKTDMRAVRLQALFFCSLDTFVISGPIPTDNRTHQRDAFIVSRDNCKWNTLQIQVKNCKSGDGDFRVYFLKRTPGCPMAYCFGE